MRRRRPEKRQILPDPVFGDLVVAKFINNLMKDGKKSLAEKTFYKSIGKIKEQGKVDDGLELFKKALDNVAPVLEVKSKRIGELTMNILKVRVAKNPCEKVAKNAVFNSLVSIFSI